MSNEQQGANSSQDIGQQVGKQAGNLANNRGVKKGLKVAANLLKKLFMTLFKGLLKILGPYVLILILVVIILLVTLEALKSFDFFGEGETRTEAEQLYDETHKNVVEKRSKDLVVPFTSDLRNQQSSYPYPPVKESYLQQINTKLAPSWALTGSMYSYAQMRNESYKSWHDKYSDRNVETPELKALAIEDFTEELNDKYDYYFDDPSMQVIRDMNTVSDEKRIVRTVTTTYTYEDVLNEEGEVIDTIVHTSVSENQTEETLPPRDIIEEGTLLYGSLPIPYHWIDTEWKLVSTTSSNNQVVEVYEMFHLYVINDSSSVNVEPDEETLLNFLMVDNPEGEAAILVRPDDVEYLLEMVSNADPNFPKISINFGELVGCMKGSELGNCIVNVGFSGGEEIPWYSESNKAIYESAAKKYNVDWWILAALHEEATSFGEDELATNPELAGNGGRRGHFQLMPLDWVGKNFTGNTEYKVNGYGNIFGPNVTEFISNKGNISTYRGFGIDGNNDGKASPYDVTDSTHTMANILKNNGYQKNNETKIKEVLSKLYNSSKANTIYSMGEMYREGVPGGIYVPLQDSKFMTPSFGWVTSRYGPRWGRIHYGLDIAKGGDVPVVASASGVVSVSTLRPSYGEAIFIKHDFGNGETYETVYAHLSSRVVSVGQTVKKGQLIGWMGNTGDSTGQHLHFEIHKPHYVYKHNALNPSNWIKDPTP